MINMRPHGGIRPQDIVILFKLLCYWYLPATDAFPKGLRKYDRITGKLLSQHLGISEAEISHSIRRSRFAGLLIGPESIVTGEIAKQALYEFLVYGIKYVFPVKPGHLTRGVPTAHSAPPLNTIIQANEQYVWPHEEGEMRGQAIEPLFRTVPEVATSDDRFYQLLTLTDALRVGRSREVLLAREVLKKLLFIKD